ncbi:hypothetical protein QQP08_006547 [Theobroma cacao]|nr:hypothetical protein QQP08_006547 [Theobroma cacao]
MQRLRPESPPNQKFQRQCKGTLQSVKKSKNLAPPWPPPKLQSVFKFHVQFTKNLQVDVPMSISYLAQDCLINWAMLRLAYLGTGKVPKSLVVHKNCPCFYKISFTGTEGRVTCEDSIY